MKPIAGGVATITRRQAWGAPRDNGKRKHAGLDLAAREGTIVVAPENGRVERVAFGGPGADMDRPWSRYGPAIVLMRGRSGLFHLLAHVHYPLVAPGELVQAGQPLAAVSELAHVHWEIRRGMFPRPGVTNYENSIDPLKWSAGDNDPLDPCAHEEREEEGKADG